MQSQQDYSSLILQTQSGCQLELVTEFGGLINSLRFVSPKGPLDVIAGLPNKLAMQNDQGFRGIPLFPLVNRLDGGQYQHMGQRYQLPINEPALNNSLHGFLQHLQPKAELAPGATSSEAVLYYHYEGQFAGYPFPAEVQMHYVLRDDSSLDVTTSVLNRHSTSIPVGIGWHPYFTLGRDLSDLSLRLPPCKRVLIDERMLPSGGVEECHEFDQLRRLSGISLDTCFALEPSLEGDLATTVLWSDQDQCGVEIWQQTGSSAYNYIQVCTAPDRQSIAIEPVSCGINALNTGEGLIMLNPGEGITAHMGVRLVTS